MARVAVAKTDLPGANVDGADVTPTLTDTDSTNDHTVANAQSGDIVCVIRNTATAQTVTHFAYTNRFGRPSTPALGASQAIPAQGGMAVFYLADLDGMLNPSNAAFEFDPSASSQKAFVLRGGGRS